MGPEETRDTPTNQGGTAVAAPMELITPTPGKRARRILAEYMQAYAISQKRKTHCATTDSVAKERNAQLDTPTACLSRLNLQSPAVTDVLKDTPVKHVNTSTQLACTVETTAGKSSTTRRIVDRDAPSSTAMTDKLECTISEQVGSLIG